LSWFPLFRRWRTVSFSFVSLTLILSVIALLWLVCWVCARDNLSIDVLVASIVFVLDIYVGVRQDPENSRQTLELLRCFFVDGALESSICRGTECIHVLLRLFHAAKNSSKSVKVSINHLIPTWRWIFRKLHYNEPMIVIATRKHNRLSLLIAIAPFRRVIRIHRRSFHNRHSTPRPSGGDVPEQRSP